MALPGMNLGNGVSGASEFEMYAHLLRLAAASLLAGAAGLLYACLWVLSKFLK